MAAAALPTADHPESDHKEESIKDGADKVQKSVGEAAVEKVQFVDLKALTNILHRAHTNQGSALLT